MKGLYSKYEVKKRSDGTPVENCFVLRPDRDDAAIAAMLAYADATSDEQLSQELREWAEFERRVKPHITNADHIRAMSDEELMEFISRVEIGDFNTSDYGKTFCGLCDFDSCDECLLDWLQQPYKEGEV